MSEPIWKQPAWLQAVAAVIIAVTALIGGVVAVLQFITPKPNDVLEKKIHTQYCN